MIKGILFWLGLQGILEAELPTGTRERSAEVIHAADQAALIMVVLVCLVLIGVVALAIKIRNHTRDPDGTRQLLDELNTTSSKDDSSSKPSDWEKPADWWKKGPL